MPKLPPRSRRFSEAHDPLENRETRLVCTCPDASAEGAHFSALVPTTKVLQSKSSGQEMKSAHLRWTLRDKCTLSASLNFPTGHDPRKIIGTSEQFSKSFFKVFFWEKNFFRHFLEVPKVRTFQRLSQRPKFYEVNRRDKK